MDQGLPYDPEDAEIALVKLRLDGPDDKIGAALGQFEAYVDATEYLEGERSGPTADSRGRARVDYELFTDRTGVISPAIERLCAILVAAKDDFVEAVINVPGYSRTFYGWERDFVVEGQRAGSG